MSEPKSRAIVPTRAPLAAPSTPTVQVLENRAELYIARVRLEPGGEPLPGVAVQIVAGSREEAGAWLRELLRPELFFSLSAARDMATPRKKAKR